MALVTYYGMLNCHNLTRFVVIIQL